MISRIFLFTLLDKRDWHWLYVRMNFKYHFLNISFSTKPTKRGRYQTSRDCCTPGWPVPSVHLHFYLLILYLIEMFLSQGLSAQGLATPHTLMSMSSACLPTASKNTVENELKHASGAAVGKHLSAADAYTGCCLQVQAKSSQCNSSCMHVYAHIPLHTVLHITRDLGLVCFLCLFIFPQTKAGKCSPSQTDAEQKELFFQIRSSCRNDAHSISLWLHFVFS